jgi:predicted aspartyl protease
MLGLALPLFGLLGVCASGVAGDLRTKVSESSSVSHIRATLPSEFMDGFVFVKVSVGGSEPVWMLLDSGDDAASIDETYAKALNLTLRPKAGGVGGFGSSPVQGYNTTVPLLAVGGVTKKKVKFVAYKLSSMPGPDGKPIAGILGYSLFDDAIIEIDYRHHEVFFQRADQPLVKDEIGLNLKDHFPVALVAIGGKPIRALIDTGGGYELLITPVAAKATNLETFLDSAQTVAGGGAAGAVEVKLGTAPDLTIGQITRNSPVTVYASFGDTKVNFEAALGKDFLKNYRVTFNYRNGTMRLQPEM